MSRGCRRDLRRVGAAHILAPTVAKPIYGLTWMNPVQPGKPADTSGSRDFESAMTRAARKDLELQALRSGMGTDNTVGGLVDAFIADGTGRGHPGADQGPPYE